MTYYVKNCPKCGAINHPTLSACRECAAALPATKTESDLPAPNPLPRPRPTVYPDPKPFAQLFDPLLDLSPARGGADDGDALSCRIVDIQMPFWSMVSFMVKWSIAAIPALIILTLIGVFVVSIFAGGVFR